MVQLLTKVKIVDNTGGTIGRCIKILKPHNRKFAILGDIILITIVKAVVGSKIKKGEVYKAVIVQTGTTSSGYEKYQQNSVVLVKINEKTKELTPIGTIIKTVISYNLKYKQGCQKLVNLAKTTI